METALVTGATGAVGPRLVHTLHEAGYHVRILSTRTPPSGLLPSAVEVQLGDITNPDAVQTAVEGREVVFHLAALLHRTSPSEDWREAYERVNVGGALNVTNAAVRAGVKRVVLFSSIAVYGCTNGSIVAEDSPAHPDTLYGRTKLAAERIVLQARRTDGGSLGTVLRFGAVYGARTKGNYERLVQALARRRFISIGDGHNRRTLVYERDVAAAALLAAQHPLAAGRLHNVSDGRFHTLSEIISAICNALGRRPPRFSLPVKPIIFMAGAMEDTLKLFSKRSPFGRAAIYKYIEDVAVDSALIQRDLGFSPQYDLAAGWRQAIRDMEIPPRLPIV